MTAAAMILAMWVSVNANASCGAAFCSVETTHYAATVAPDGERSTNSSLDFRYEYINQNQPHAGTRDIDVGEIKHHHDEVRTLNQNLVATYIRNFEHWALVATLPFVSRDHAHIHNHAGAQLGQQWTFKEVGDARVSGRYRLTHDLNVSVGLQLPTGRTNVRNEEGELAERSLQPGAGTIGGILGVHYHQMISDRNYWFVQAHYVGALNKHHDYAPGSQIGVDGGLSWSFASRWTALGQLNLLVKQRDRGDQAEPDDSGGTFLALSPGVSFSTSRTTELYAYYQQPLYQNVNGVQLIAHQSVILGLKILF